MKIKHPELKNKWNNADVIPPIGTLGVFKELDTDYQTSIYVVGKYTKSFVYVLVNNKFELQEQTGWHYYDQEYDEWRLQGKIEKWMELIDD